MLALNYTEQQTAGSRNLHGLQCWAGLYNLFVVEPTISNSVPITTLSLPNFDKQLKFSDFFDISEWNKLSSSEKHAQLVSWENFILFAPRDVILVNIHYLGHEDVDENLKELGNRISPFQRSSEGCVSNWTSVKQFLHNHQFNVVRQVCFNFAYGDSLSFQEFKSRLYGNTTLSSCTVVFDEWRDIGKKRLFLANSPIGNVKTHLLMVGPSQKLLLYAQNYRQKYLGGDPYIALHVRMEKVQIYLSKREHGIMFLKTCFTRLLKVWNEIKAQFGFSNTLLAVDMGRFGSNTLMERGNITVEHLNSRFEKFFRQLYGGTRSVKEWEDSFENVLNTTDAGYVAALQKTLVATADCVVFMGGGSFQRHALSLYLRNHSGDGQCIREIEGCNDHA